VEHFSDTFFNKLDAKGRVSLPAKFRQSLSAQGAESVFIIQSHSLGALEGFGPVLLNEINARLSVLDPFSEEYDAFAHAYFGGSIELAWDGEGRIKLPEHFLTYAKITDEAVFVGLGQKFQIWDPAGFEINRRRTQEVAQKNRGLLSLRNVGERKG
jgi:MraZ protein